MLCASAASVLENARPASRLARACRARSSTSPRSSEQTRQRIDDFARSIDCEGGRDRSGVDVPDAFERHGRAIEAGRQRQPSRRADDQSRIEHSRLRIEQRYAPASTRRPLAASQTVGPASDFAASAGGGRHRDDGHDRRRVERGPVDQVTPDVAKSPLLAASTSAASIIEPAAERDDDFGRSCRGTESAAGMHEVGESGLISCCR